jgi:hypothetical protein
MENLGMDNRFTKKMKKSNIKHEGMNNVHVDQEKENYLRYLTLLK